MNPVSIRFLKAALIYLALGTLLGLAMALRPDMRIHVPTHVHLLLLGWMSMMIYGIGYHILPRFSGTPLFSDRMAGVQFWLANIGLIGMAYSWESPRAFPHSLAVFSSVEAVSIALFVYNVWRTIP